MNQSDIVEEKDNKQINIGPGDQLQAARIEQGLTIEDVATRMHLSLAILESIEENNFDDITAPIFVKGYLRAYARLVSLNEDDMIQRYVEFYSNEDPPINTTSQMAPEISAQDARVKWTTYLVIIVLIALLSAWWWNKAQDQTESVSLDADQQSDRVTTEQVTEPEIVEASGESDEVVDETGSLPLLEETSSADALDSIPSEDPLAENVAKEAPKTVVTTVIETVENTPEPEVTADTITAVADTLTTEEAIKATTGLPFDISRSAPTGIDLLSIIVNADTWADIKDANNHRLVYDLLRANLSVQVRGQAPFNAFFGNGHGVEISFNSESIDIASRILDDNTARIKIGTN
jgi:cytoskeleton protein RodZ